MFHLKYNLPRWERALRLGAGLGMAGAVYAGWTSGLLTWLTLVSAASLALTAFVGFCPACAMVGRKFHDPETDKRV